MYFDNTLQPLEIVKKISFTFKFQT